MDQSLILTRQEQARVEESLRKYPWYREIFDGLKARVDELIERRPPIPVEKGRGFYESCPDDHALLIFDPYNPSDHICPKCGRNWTGPLYNGAWVRQFQVWMQSRLVEAGILLRLTGEEAYARLIRETLLFYAKNYERYPLANNLLGPTRIFQSTYIEALWLGDLVAAFDLLHSADGLDRRSYETIRERLFYPSARIVRSFDERRSNRQAFYNVGMGALGLLFHDQEWIDHALDGPHGFSYHMRESVLEDGLWYEGETYHFATLHHLITLAEMARHRGIDLYTGASPYGSLASMFSGPLGVLYPDLTFPSRKDSWYGRGIDYHKEVYEIAYARYGDPVYGGLLYHAYQTGPGRKELSWRSFLYLNPDLPAATVDELRPKESIDMRGTGIVLLRAGEGGTVAGMEYGHYGGGHGHPDRLSLVFASDGMQWFLDPGTGWYHVPELAWYRATLAHNTVVVDGVSQTPHTEGELTAFAAGDEVRVAQGVAEAYPGVTTRRTLVLTDDFLFDHFEVVGGREHQLDWVVHTLADVEVHDATAMPLGDGAKRVVGHQDGYEFLSAAAQIDFKDRSDSPGRTPGWSATLTAPAPAFDGIGAQVRLSVRQLLTPSEFQLFQAKSPGIPLREEHPMNTIIARCHASHAVFATLYARTRELQRADLRQDGVGSYVVTVDHREIPIALRDGVISVGSVEVPVRTPRRAAERVDDEVPEPHVDRPLYIAERLGALNWEDSWEAWLESGEREALKLNRPDQVLWAEFPWESEEDCSARARIFWDDTGLYLVCQVRDDVLVMDTTLPDLYENDSIQVYFDFRPQGERGNPTFTPGIAAYILAPAIDGAPAKIEAIAGNREISNRGARAAWFTTEGVRFESTTTADGYVIKAHFPYTSMRCRPLKPGDEIGFDLAVSDNDGTWYRKFQMVWSGARGRRCYIRGSYHNPEEYGRLVVEA